MSIPVVTVGHTREDLVGGLERLHGPVSVVMADVNGLKAANLPNCSQPARAGWPAPLLWRTAAGN